VADEDVQQIQVPIVWTGAENVPILFANGFVVQFDTDLAAYILTVGQLSPPALVGTPEEMREQAERLDFVTVQTIARIAFTPARMTELIGALQANLDQMERAANLRPGDPR
jgi:hypothetical protein